LKTITSNFNTIKSFLGLILLGVTLTANAQGFTNGNLYVHDNGEMHVAANNFSFSATGSTGTSRTTGTFGKISFAASATWSGAVNGHHVNGYVRTYKGDGTQFIFPIGNGTVYAPAATKSNATTGVDAAYISSNPTGVGIPLDATVDKISNSEYWHVKGTKTEVTISWRASSNVAATLTNSLIDLTIAGWDGTKWVALSSVVDGTSIMGATSSITSGSITTAAAGLSTMEYFTLAAKDKACMPLVAMTGATRTFNGTSWDTVPTEIDNAVISAAGSPGSFVCNSLSLGANNITLTNGQVVEVVKGVTGTGKIIMSSEASFVQRDGTAAAPSIELLKQSRPVRRWDYIYWGTPISGDFFADLSGTNVYNNFNTVNPFGAKLYWNAAALNTANVTEPSVAWGGTVTLQTTGTNWYELASITTGKGFATRIKDDATAFTYDPAVQRNVLYKFVGTANNGDISVSTDFQVIGASNSRYNLIGNPYPSAISASDLIEENKATLSGTVYFWANNSTYFTGAYSGGASGDYATYAVGSGTATASAGIMPNNNIGSAQGFLVRRTGVFGTDGGVKNVLLNNCMRVTDVSSNNIFFRNAQQNSTKDRFWINLTPQNGTTKQIAVVYMDGVTNGYDESFDGPLYSVTTNKFYSLIDNGRYAINARPTFNLTDVVPVGFTKANTNEETFTFSLANVEGLFDENVDVILHDKVLNVYHNLTDANYTFTSNATLDNSRFEIVYQTNALSNPDFTNSSVVMMLNNNLFSIQAKESIEMVSIYDISGRIVESYKVENNTEFQGSFMHEEGIYIAKVKMTNGNVISQKLINIQK